jgi:hypothetical protein
MNVYIFMHKKLISSFKDTLYRTELNFCQYII